MFYSYGDVTMAGEGLQILTYAHYGHWPVRVLKLATPTVITYFYDSGLSRPGFEQPSIRLRGQRSYPLHQRRSCAIWDAQ